MQLPKHQFVGIFRAMVPTPLALFEVEEKMIFADTSQLCQPGLGIAPERFDSIDVVFASSKLVVVMMDAIMLITIPKYLIRKPGQ